MKAIALIALTALVSPVAHASDLCASATTTGSTTLRTKVCEALAAVNRKDRVALSELMADDFSLLGVTGKYFGSSKEEMVARWTSGTSGSVPGSSKLARIYRESVSGNAGFIAGEIEDRVNENGERRCYLHAFTDLWEKRGDSWVWVHSHESGVRAAQCSE